MQTSVLDENQLGEAVRRELLTRARQGTKLHCAGTLATALGTVGLVASLQGDVGDWRRIAVWAGLVVVAAAALYVVLVVRDRELPANPRTIDGTLVTCALSGLLVGSVGWFDLSSMQHESFAYALAAATLAFCVGTLVTLNPLSVLIAVSIIPAVLSLSVSLFVTGNVAPGVCSLIVLALIASALPRMGTWVFEVVRSRMVAQYASTHDPLTGVWNRAGLQPLLSEVHSLAYGDIDNFKQINDHFGHAAGDGVIKEVAARLVAVAEPHGAHVARFGGDEFVVVAESSELIPQVLVAEINDAMAAPFDGVGSVRFSVGTGSRSSLSPESLLELFTDADRALYRAKREVQAANSALAHECICNPAASAEDGFVDRLHALMDIPID